MLNKVNEVAVETAASVSDNQDVKLGVKEVVAKIVGEIFWVTEAKGFCECPGKGIHTTSDGRRDCMIYLDQIPTVYCVHASCRVAIDQTNKKLRAALLNGENIQDKRKLTSEEKARIQERERETNIRKRAAASRDQILGEYRWAYETIQNDSPVELKSNVGDHWRLLLGCFQPDDVIWIGDKYHSGKAEHKRNFLTAADWLKKNSAFAQLICPAVFKPDTFARSNDNVLARRFIVVESDILGRDEVGAIFRWLEKEVGLKLRAIVDTAGKSLHAWFDYPPEAIVDEMKLVLPELGCDPKLFTPSQPVRLPGALRDEKYQKLVYLSKEATV